MNIVASLALLQLFLSAAGEFWWHNSNRCVEIRCNSFLLSRLKATVSGNFSTETVQSAAPGDVVLLQCYTGGNLTPVWTTWVKDGHVIASNGELHVDSSAKDPRLTLERNGSLSISKVISDDTGSFLCSSRLPDNRTINAHVLLQVTSKWGGHEVQYGSSLKRFFWALVACSRWSSFSTKLVLPHIHLPVHMTASELCMTW